MFKKIFLPSLACLIFILLVIAGCSKNGTPADGGSVSIEWVSIPAGNFIMGSTAADTAIWPYTNDEYPQHIVYLNDYQISKYEITNAQYKTFIDAGGYSKSTYWSTDGWKWRTDNSITEPRWWYKGKYNSGNAFPNYPVVGICWHEADAFCRWAGGRLPTSAEWEKAARGTDAHYWPWGNIWDATKCNSEGTLDGYEKSAPVGSFPSGVSPYGVYDMAGNVLEWCNDWYQSGYYSVSSGNNPTGPITGTRRVLRDGCWANDSSYCRTAIYLGDDPSGRADVGLFGFRIAK